MVQAGQQNAKNGLTGRGHVCFGFVKLLGHKGVAVSDRYLLRTALIGCLSSQASIRATTTPCGECTGSNQAYKSYSNRLQWSPCLVVHEGDFS